MRLTMLSALAAVLVLETAAAQDEATKKELARFQGTWKVIGYEAADKEKPPPGFLEMTRFVFLGDRLIIKLGDKQTEETAFKIDPTKKPPTIDIQSSRGPNKGKFAAGIYAFEGGTLKICAGAPDQKRPTAFKSEPGSKTAVITLQRDKK